MPGIRLERHTTEGRPLRLAPVTEGRPLDRWARLLLFPPVHAAAYALRWVGLRARLRCPHCKAVGTWKPHGTLSARWFHKDRPVRRWMCKWCGLYVGPEGVIRVFPDLTREPVAWALPQPWDPWAPEEPGPTPADVVADALTHGNGRTVWPWRG